MNKFFRYLHWHTTPIPKISKKVVANDVFILWQCPYFLDEI